MTHLTRLGCACGRLRLEVEGAPIVSAECYCNSCRAAGARLRTLPASPLVVDAHGGTRFVLYRKDRIRFLEGTDALKEFRLAPDAKTRRVVATCCNTPAFLEFQNGHWLSLYGCLWPSGTLPPLELRTMTSDLPHGLNRDDGVKNGKRQSIAFFAKLLGAWIAMRFRTPKITVVSGQLQI